VTAAGVAAVGTALEGLNEALRADGYAMSVLAADCDCVKMRVEAGEHACEECLVPKDILIEMIRGSLPREFGGARIDLEYPGEDGAIR
jgi:hypothetical protein